MKSISIFGSGTAGLIAGLMIRQAQPNIEINIFSSSKKGIVGVGEGSTEHWHNLFESYADIDFREVIARTNATIKIGIRFDNWTKTNSSYVHSVEGGMNTLTPSFIHDLYNYAFINNEDQLNLAPVFKHAYNKNAVTFTGGSQELITNQYHFDTFLLNDFLIEKCKQRYINFYDVEIEKIEVGQSNSVTKVYTTEGVVVSDLYIDCSGFARLFSKAQKNRWISKKEYLPMDTAIAFPTELTNPADIEPFTTSTALSSGWAWKIPTQERYGNGYVFNSAYTTKDKALKEIASFLNQDIEKYARSFSFDAGSVERFWDKNVIYLGLAGSFAEPLEAQSIGFTIVQIRTFLQYLNRYEVDTVNTIEQYNFKMKESFNNIIDYIQLHYITDKDDSEFWQDKPFKITDFNTQILPVLQHGLISPSNFPVGEHIMFNSSNWYMVAAGLNLIDKEKVKVRFKNNTVRYNNTCREVIEHNYQRLRENVESFFTHRQYLEEIKKRYWNR